jgi:membrane associated rhomboid family serine protease
MSYQDYRPSSFQILPPVIKNILIINVLLYVASIIIRKKYGIDLADLLGLHYFFSDKFSPYQVISYMFMHSYIDETGEIVISHIFFNMFALWMFGAVLENFWGAKRFLTFYLICGIGAALTHYTIFYFKIQPTLSLINDYIASPDLENFKAFFSSQAFIKLSPQSISQELKDALDQFYKYSSAGNEASSINASLEFIVAYKKELLNEPVVIGASGSIFGILLAFGMLFPNTILYLMFIPFPIKAKYAVTGYGLFELIAGIYNSPSDNVAHFAHLGGMLFGFILIKYWGTTNRNQFY